MGVDRRNRWAGGLAVTGALLALAGCGQVEPGDRAGTGGSPPLEPEPPIEAVDGPWGPCVEDEPADCGETVCMWWDDPGCSDEICASESTFDRPAVLFAVVPAAGDRIEVELRSGETRAYALRGPTVREFPEKRMFMVELDERYRALEVFDGERLLARSELPEPYLHMLACIDRFEGDESDTDWEEDDRRLRECLEGVLPDLGGEQGSAGEGS